MIVCYIEEDFVVGFVDVVLMVIDFFDLDLWYLWVIDIVGVIVLG